MSDVFSDALAEWGNDRRYPEPAVIGDFSVRLTMVPGMYTATVTGNRSGRSVSASNVLWSNAMLEAMHQLAKGANAAPYIPPPTCCPHCEYDEAEGFLIAQCEVCEARG